MGDSQNAFFGNPDNIKYAGSGIGYAEDSSMNLAITKEDVKAGNPLRLIQDFFQSIALTFEAKLKEAHPDNHLLALGVQKNIITNVEGSVNNTYWKTLVTRVNETAYPINTFLEPVTLNGCLYEVTVVGSEPHQSGSSPPAYPTTVGETVADGDLTLTCRAYPGESCTIGEYEEGSLAYIQLTGYNIKADADVIVYNPDYTTKYVLGTDYWMDAVLGGNGSVTGKIFIIPGSALDTAYQGGTVTSLKVVYKYTPITKKKISLNPNTILLDSSDLEFIYTNKKTGKKFAIIFSDFTSDGSASRQVNEKSTDLQLKGSAKRDPRNPDYEFAQIIFYA